LSLLYYSEIKYYLSFLYKMIYEPLEDSFLLNKTLIKFFKNKDKKIKILDVGSGSGIQAETCLKLGFKNVIASDINKETAKYLREKNIKFVHSDLFDKIKGRFDLIIFNPPYLPHDYREPEESKMNTTGGKKGYEIIIKFLKQSSKKLNKNGSIILLFSSLSNPKLILERARDFGYNFSLLDKNKFFFEELYVYELFR